MDKKLVERLKALAANGPSDVLWGGLKGIEKEALRVDDEGNLSNRSHPVALGSALTSKYITTDFSEALLEFVTPAFANTWETLRFLCDIHQFAYAGLDDELLWVTSMPCVIPDDEKIPLARYGKSNIGRMKTLYRRGLGYRYGRAMQTIAGVHFNYSVPDAFWPVYHDLCGNGRAVDELRSDAYLGLIRNFRRLGWLVLYLFGASPALCKSFVGQSAPRLASFDEHTFFEPYATSLRMSDLGYSNKTQAGIDISLNSLDEYVRDLRAAINTVEPAYEKIGVKVDGRYRQLNANKLQIENEYYSPVRPKRVARSGEKPTAALLRGGIEYVEIRSIDVNVFDPVGINQNVMRFVEALLIYCLLSDSPPIAENEWQAILRNHMQTARHGRDPDFRLLRSSAEVSLRDWASEIVEGVAAVAELIDRADGQGDYSAAVRAQAALVNDSDATPSARILAEMRDQDTGFFYYALAAAKGHRDYFAELAPMQAEQLAMLQREAAESLERQAQIEAADTMNFDEFLEHYFQE
ncbi:MAG: glutamate--cysteine ligase [Gammaproteobacteria bacterium]|nr:glutamate--cysteine ligase [Gammaproteobacteria bacterium]